MFNVGPKKYSCPFCKMIEHPRFRKGDVVFESKSLFAFMSTVQPQANPEKVLIIPKRHIENIFDLPNTLVVEITNLARRIGKAMRQAYPCGGITFVQNNGQGQRVFHYHLHVIPRYKKDHLFEPGTKPDHLVAPRVRKKYARILKNALRKSSK